MKGKKRICIGLLFVVLMIVCTSCASEEEAVQDADEFIARMIQAADGAVVTQSDCNMVFDVTLGKDAEAEEIRAEYLTHNKYDKESVRSSSEIGHITENGEYVNIAQINLSVEQEDLYYYAYSENSGWIKYEACLEKGEISRNFVSSMNLDNAEVLEFETEGVQLEGKDVYKLSVSLKDANIRELVFESGLKVFVWCRECASMDLSDITVEVDYYVEPETAQVLKLEAKLDGMQNFIKEYVQISTHTSLEDSYRVAELNECTLVYDNISYEDFYLPMMAFEDKKNSLFAHQKDTDYTLNILNDEVEIICPRGWCVENQEQAELRIIKAAGGIRVFYEMFYERTTEEYLTEMLPKDIEYVKEQGAYIADGVGPKMGEFDTHEIIINGGVFSVAYAPVGKSLLVVYVFDYTSNRLDRSLPEVLEMVHITK